MDLKSFYSPRSRYRGDFTPANLLFNANLQEFSQRVAIISGLETNGKMTPEESYKKVKHLFEQLTRSYEQLGTGKPDSPDNAD